MADINQPAGARYANTDEMKAEFGSYRVNNKTNTICDSSVPDYKVDNMEWTAAPIDDSM